MSELTEAASGLVSGSKDPSRVVNLGFGHFFRQLG